MTDRWSRGVGTVALMLLLGLAGCGGTPEVSLNEDPEAYRDEVRDLEARLSDDPTDAEALRDLGAIYMRTGRPARAYDRLKKAYARTPRDPKTQFFLGLASEGVGKDDAALRLYKRFDRIPTSSGYRELMEGRYEWMVRKRAEEDIRAMLERESELAADRVSPRVLAVLPLEYQGSDDTYAPLSRGLAEMMTTDLARIDQLRVVERVRLQALLDELKLAQSEYVDPSTAPRVGKLLGAGRLLSGSYVVTSDERLRVDATLAEIDSEIRFPNVDARYGPLDDLFRLQDEIIFHVVDMLGVELTPQQRAAIEDVPTRDLQAFLAYSQGLQQEDQGNFEAAAQQYRRATQIDPSFEAPAQRQSKAQGLSSAGGSRESALTSAARMERANTSSKQVGRRLRNMGVGTVGGPQRRPAEEVGTATESILDPFPAPPRRQN